MINFAHRGDSSNYPENTIIAFKNAINSGATGIELDVHKTKDNKIVVIHDEDIERTFKGKGLIKDLTLKELRLFKCRKVMFTEEKEALIPTLEEVLELIKLTDIVLNIEIKTDVIHYEGIEKDVIDLVNKYNLNNRIILSSFNHKSIKLCKEIDVSINTGMLYYEPIESAVEYAKSIGADAIHPNLTLVSKELIEEAHINNIKVNIYTVNDPVYMRKLIDLSADGLFTDDPSLLKEIISEKSLLI
ncbi:MAG: glycerophosphodiester phosphodiesterase [Clostridium sp.]